MKKKDLLQRLEDFAVRVVELADKLPNTHGARAVGFQVAKSAISVAHNYAESQAASSKKHFISYVEISEREARETYISLRIIDRRQYLQQENLTELLQENNEIIAILTSIGRKAKENVREIV